MIKTIIHKCKENSALVLITFEAFWIIVFLLDRLSHSGGSQVPQFVYVNF